MRIILDIGREILIAADIITNIESVLLVIDAVKVVGNDVAVTAAIHMTRYGHFLSERLV